MACGARGDAHSVSGPCQPECPVAAGRNVLTIATREGVWSEKSSNALPEALLAAARDAVREAAAARPGENGKAALYRAALALGLRLRKARSLY